MTDEHDLRQQVSRNEPDTLVYCHVCHGEGTVSDSDLPCLKCDGAGAIPMDEYDSDEPAVRAC